MYRTKRSLQMIVSLLILPVVMIGQLKPAVGATHYTNDRGSNQQPQGQSVSDFKERQSESQDQVNLMNSALSAQSNARTENGYDANGKLVYAITYDSSGTSTRYLVVKSNLWVKASDLHSVWIPKQVPPKHDLDDHFRVKYTGNNTFEVRYAGTRLDFTGANYGYFEVYQKYTYDPRTKRAYINKEVLKCPTTSSYPSAEYSHRVSRVFYSNGNLKRMVFKDNLGRLTQYNRYNKTTGLLSRVDCYNPETGIRVYKYLCNSKGQVVKRYDYDSNTGRLVKRNTIKVEPEDGLSIQLWFLNSFVRAPYHLTHNDPL